MEIGSLIAGFLAGLVVGFILARKFPSLLRGSKGGIIGGGGGGRKQPK